MCAGHCALWIPIRPEWPSHRPGVPLVSAILGSASAKCLTCARGPVSSQAFRHAEILNFKFAMWLSSL